MRKTFILDTNVVLYEAESIFKFDEHNVVIPNTVLEEVDKFKKNQDETGRNARRFTRYLDELRAVGPMTEGVPLNGDGGKLFVKLYTNDLAFNNLDMSKPDNRILAVAFSYKGQGEELITKDVNLRVTAGAFGVRASDYEHEKIDIDTLYTGWRDGVASSEVINILYTKKYLPVELVSYTSQAALFPNEFVLVSSDSMEGHTALCRYDAKTRNLVLLRSTFVASGLKPKNVEQSFALDLLLDDNIKIVTLVGKAGTGKTLLALAAGLQKVMDEGVFRKMIVSRPVFPMGRDLGFLPGDLDEKLAPWMQPIKDNLDYLLQDYRSVPEKPARKQKPRKDSSGKSTKGRTQQIADHDEKDEGRFSSGYKELQDFGILEVEPLVYIRGRSIPNQFMVVDEVQNLTPHEIKTIITRAGEGTKIVLTGDPQQIDNVYVDTTSNGLTYVVEKMKQHDIAGHVILSKGERSALAELASDIL